MFCAQVSSVALYPPALFPFVEIIVRLKQLLKLKERKHRKINNRDTGTAQNLASLLQREATPETDPRQN